MTIQEQNRIIANFMGGEVREVVRINDKVTMAWCGHIAKQWRKEKLGINVGDAILENQLEFHSDWNWLMPVVEKIESIYDDHHGYFGVHIHSNCCVIQGTYLHRALDEPLYGAVYISDINALLPTKIESTYYAVVQFIKWYNSNLKKDHL